MLTKLNILSGQRIQNEVAREVQNDLANIANRNASHTVAAYSYGVSAERNESNMWVRGFLGGQVTRVGRTILNSLREAWDR